MRLFKSVFAIVAVASAAIISESCVRQSEQAVEFETRVDSVGYMVPDFHGDSLFFAAKYSVVWPEKIGRDDFDALRDSLLHFTFGDASAATFNDAAHKFLLNGLTSYEAEADTVLAYVEVPYDTAFNAARSTIAVIAGDVTLLTPKVLVVQVQRYDYAYGTVHGMNTTRYLNYSLVNRRLITTESIFKPGSTTAILDLINASAKKHYPQEGALFPEPITGMGSIRITENDIVFVYQPYEIGPYSTGVVNIPVSRYDLYRFMTPEAYETLADD